MGLFSKDKNKEFWDWFINHEAEYYEFEKNQDHLFNELIKKLQKVSKAACFEFSTAKNGKREFIISADGIISEASKIKVLVNAAPKLAKFKIIAFRPRKGDGIIEMGDLRLTADAITFNYSFNEVNRVDLMLHIDKPVAYNEQQLMGAVFVLVDMTVGEYDMMTKVGMIEIAGKGTMGLPKPRKLSELPTILDTRTPNEIT